MIEVLPLLPGEVDLRDFEFMPLDVRRLRDSRLISTRRAEEIVAAILLWSASWHQIPASSLPDDNLELSQLAGYGRAVSEFEKIREGALHGLIRCSDGRYYHPVVTEKAVTSWNSKLIQRHKRACDAQRKENKARSERNESPMPMPAAPFLLEKRYQSDGIPIWKYPNSSGNLDFSAGIPPESNNNSAGIPPESIGFSDGSRGLRDSVSVSVSVRDSTKSRASTRGSRLPDDFEMPQPWIGWALGEQPSWLLDHALKISRVFKDYWIAQPGQKGVKVNWESTWRNWVRKEGPMAKGATRGEVHYQPKSATLRAMEKLDAMIPDSQK